MSELFCKERHLSKLPVAGLHQQNSSQNSSSVVTSFVADRSPPAASQRTISQQLCAEPREHTQAVHNNYGGVPRAQPGPPGAARPARPRSFGQSRRNGLLVAREIHDNPLTQPNDLLAITPAQRAEKHRWAVNYCNNSSGSKARK